MKATILKIGLIFLISFLITGIADYQFVKDHERLHADIFNRDGCAKTTIEAAAFIGGKTTCTDSDYTYSEKAMEINTLVDIVGYHLRPFILLGGGFAAFGLSLLIISNSRENNKNGH